MTVSRLQAVTYLFGVCLFSISFLVFMNSSISFVITDVLQEKQGVGNAVGTLGFLDELVALVACPVWGVLSDRIGVRTVSGSWPSCYIQNVLTSCTDLRPGLCHRGLVFGSFCPSQEYFPSTITCEAPLQRWRLSHCNDGHCNTSLDDSHP